MFTKSDRVRIAIALAITTSCGAHQVAVGLSGEPLERWTYADAVEARTTILPEAEPPTETSLYMKEEQVSVNTYLEVGTTSTLLILDHMQHYRASYSLAIPVF